MSGSGWIPAWRRIFEPDHWLAPSKRAPASELHAWLDLCQMATYRPRETRRSGTLQAGEVIVSVRTLAKRWGWSKSRVQRFASDLEARTAIGTVRGTPDGTVYRVVNYETYAIRQDTERDTERDEVRDIFGTAAGQEQQGNKETSSSQGARARSFPKGWKPNEKHRAKAVALRLDVEQQAEEFEDKAKAKGWKYIDWDAAFRNFLTNARRYLDMDAAKRNGNGQAPREPPALTADQRSVYRRRREVLERGGMDPEEAAAQAMMEARA